MRSFTLFYCALSASIVHSLYVTSGSPCSTTCKAGNGTTWADLVCSDSDFSTNPTGQVLQQCINCESQSLYYNGTKSDEYWFLFHLKYTQQSCLMENNLVHAVNASNCATVCSPLRTTLETLWIQKEPFLPQYDYCTINANAYPTYAPGCASCLQSQLGTVIVGNMVETMVNACNNQPLAANGKLVQMKRNLFDTTVILSSTGTSTNASVGTSTSTLTTTEQTSTAGTAPGTASETAPGDRGLSTGAAVGVGVGVAVAIIAAVIAFVYYMKARRIARRTKLAEMSQLSYIAQGRTKDTKKAIQYREMSTEPAASELYGQERQELYGRATTKKRFPVVELPEHPR